MKRIKYIISAIVFFAIPAIAVAEGIPNTDLEDNSLSSWNKGTQSGTLENTITGSGTGVTIFSGTVIFQSGSHGSVGSPTLADGSPNPYYQPAVNSATWAFGPYGTYGVAMQPNGSQQFSDAIVALGISSEDETSLTTELSNQASASGYGSGNPTDSSWITKSVTLQAGTIYTMSWNYIGTDYVPFNDGSITSLTPVSVSGTPSISVNNSGKQFALLGFTNPGTGDYSTGTFGSTGWQISTYEVSITGDYLLGFAVFNLDDTALSPVLLIDSQPGVTQKNGEDFGAVAPNNPDAPTVPPTVTDPPATDPPATDPPATDPPTTDPPATDPPATDPPATDPPATDPPATDPPTTEPEEITTTTEGPRRPRPRPTTTTTTIPVAVQTTTTQPDIVVPPTTTPIDGGSELPKTGNGITMFYVGLISTVIGYGILSVSNKRKVK